MCAHVYILGCTQGYLHRKHTIFFCLRFTILTADLQVTECSSLVVMETRDHDEKVNGL